MPRTMSVCESQITTEESADRLYAFLKTGADTTQPEVNASAVTGLNPDPYAAPPLRKDLEGTDSALWGQEPESDGKATAQVHSNAVWDGFRAGRERFLERNFDSFKPSQEQTQALLSGQLEHFKSGDHESSTPFTRDHSKRRPVEVETVFDKTKRLLGT